MSKAELIGNCNEIPLLASPLFVFANLQPAGCMQYAMLFRQPYIFMRKSSLFMHKNRKTMYKSRKNKPPAII